MRLANFFMPLKRQLALGPFRAFTNHAFYAWFWFSNALPKTRKGALAWLKTLYSKSYVFYTCSTQPPIPETLDFIGFSDGLEDQELYVFSPSVLPKIQGMFLCLFFSCFQRRFPEVRKSNFWKSQKRTSGWSGGRVSAELTPFWITKGYFWNQHYKMEREE